MARPKKKRNTRTDAALDAMRHFGFADDLILTTLKQLLKVYGEDNWFFIEENAYKVLLDSIIEQVEQDAIPPLAYQEAHQGDIGAGSSRDVLPLPHSDTETSDIALQTSKGLESASQFNGGCDDTALLTSKPYGGNGHFSPAAEGTDSNQINLDQNSIEKHMTAAIETSGIEGVRGVRLSTLRRRPSLLPGDIGAGSSRDVLPLPHSDTETSDITLQTSKGLESASQFFGGCDDTASLTSKPAEGTDSNQINLDQNSIEKHMTAVIETSGIDHIGNAYFSPLHATHSPQATNGVKISKRRPYHGWIDDDEEDGEVDFVELEPMPLSPELARLLSDARSSRQEENRDFL